MGFGGNLMFKIFVATVLSLCVAATWGFVKMAPSPPGNRSSEDATTSTHAANSSRFDAAQDEKELLARCTRSLAPALGGVNLLNNLNEVFSKGASTLHNIDEAESARSAVPELAHLSALVDDVLVCIDSLPDAAKQAIALRVKRGLRSLKAADDKANAIPGVQPVLRPVVEPLLAKLTALTNVEG